MAYGDRAQAGTPGAPAKGMMSASPGKKGKAKGKSGGAFANMVNVFNAIAENFGNSSNINPSSPPISDKGQSSDNPDRLPSGAAPGGTRVKYTFAGANPLTTSGFPVGHPNYKPPGSPDGADAVRANIINRKKKIAGSAGSSGSLTSTGSSATPALLGT